jgi:hypothetical protein
MLILEEYYKEFTFDTKERTIIDKPKIWLKKKGAQALFFSVFAIMIVFKIYFLNFIDKI